MTTINLAETPKFPARTIYDTGNGIADSEEPNLSLVARAPYFVSVGPVPATSTIEIQVKLMTTGPWVKVAEYTDSEPQLLVFDARPNFVRAERTSGSDDVRVDAQGES